MQAPTPDSILPDPELISLDETAEANGIVTSLSSSSAELIELSPTDNDVDYGGENCKCRCHVKVGQAEDGSHCRHCALTVRNCFSLLVAALETKVFVAVSQWQNLH
jgi:hypothetical protein